MMQQSHVGIFKYHPSLHNVTKTQFFVQKSQNWLTKQGSYDAKIQIFKICPNETFLIIFEHCDTTSCNPLTYLVIVRKFSCHFY